MGQLSPPLINANGGISYVLNQPTATAVGISKTLLLNTTAAIASVWAGFTSWRLSPQANASVLYTATLEVTPLNTSIYNAAQKTMHISTVTPHYMRLHDMLRETENEINKAIPTVKASDLKQKNRMATDWEKVSTNVGILVDLSQQTELDFGYLVERFAHIWEDAMCATEKINTPMYLRIYRLSGICTVEGAATRIWHRYLRSPIVFSTFTVAHVIVWETSYCTARLDQLTSSSFCVYWLDWVPGLGPYIQETLIHRERAFKNLVIFLAGMSKDMASLYNGSKDGVRITKQGEELLRHIGEVWRKNSEQVTIEADIMSRREKEQGSINIALSTFWSWFGYLEARENLTEKRARLMRQQELLIEVQQPY